MLKVSRKIYCKNENNVQNTIAKKPQISHITDKNDI